MSLEADICRDANPTPTRFLLECGAFTPGFGLDTYNPFDASLKFLSTGTPKAEFNPFDTSFKTPSAAISVKTNTSGPTTTTSPTQSSQISSHQGTQKQLQQQRGFERHPWADIMMDDMAMPMPQMSPGLSPSSSSSSSSASPSPPISSPPPSAFSLDQYHSSMTIPPHATDSHTYEHNPNFINVAPSKKSFHSEHPPRDYSPVSSDPHPYHIPNGHQHLAQPKDNRRFPENVQQIHHYYQNQTQFRSQDHDDEGDGDDEHELKGMAGDSGVDDAMSALRMRRQSHEVSSMNSSSSSSVRSSNNGDEPFSPIDRDLQSSSAKSVTAKSKKSGQATTVTGRKTGPRKRKNDGESPEVKRQKFLERNRMAASKCREKKRLQTLKTISDADEISARNQALHETLDELQEEVRRLKNQILCHHDCGCDVIQKFVQSSFDYDSSSCTSSSSSSSISNDSNGPSSGHRHHATAAFASEMHVVSMPSFRI